MLVPLQPRHALPQQLAIQLEADPDDVAALLGAEQVAGTAELEVAHGDAKARAELVVLPDGAQPLPGQVQHARVPVEQQVGVGLVLETADAAAQLVELRQAEAVRALDDEGVAIRDVEAALDDRGANQHLVLPGDEIGHHALEPVRAHPAVADADVHSRQQLAQPGRDQIDAEDAVVQVENLPAAPQLVLDRLDDQLLVVAFHDGLDGQPV